MKNLNNFLNKIKEECSLNNISLEFINQEYLQLGDSSCSGFFSKEKMNISVAIKKEKNKWMEVLIHEYCHMIQFLNKDTNWENLYLNKNLSYNDILNLWLSRDIELNENQKEKVFSSIIDLELDCEKKVVLLINENKLEIDSEVYIKKANSYLYFYTFVKNYRFWPNGLAPYEIKEILDKMPNQFQNDYNDYNQEILEIYEKYYLK